MALNVRSLEAVLLHLSVVIAKEEKKKLFTDEIQQIATDVSIEVKKKIKNYCLFIVNRNVSSAAVKKKS